MIKQPAVIRICQELSPPHGSHRCCGDAALIKEKAGKSMCPEPQQLLNTQQTLASSRPGPEEAPARRGGPAKFNLSKSSPGRSILRPDSTRVINYTISMGVSTARSHKS